jgi:DNA-binding HxlR family transcriptional regulator
MRVNLGIPATLLSDRLSRLVREEILEKRPYQSRPPRWEHRLTDKGRDLYAACVALLRWGDDWLAGEDGPPLRLTHRGCGKRFRPTIACSECARELRASEVSYSKGPGAGFETKRRWVRQRTSRPEILARGRDCSVTRAVKRLGDRWTFLVLREAFFGARRFGEYVERLSIARNILTHRLAALVENEILEQRRYQRRPERHEYRLTKMGLALYPFILAAMAWGDRWLAEPAGPPLLLAHDACGRRIRPALVCPACKAQVTARNVAFREVRARR